VSATPQKAMAERTVDLTGSYIDYLKLIGDHTPGMKINTEALMREPNDAFRDFVSAERLKEMFPDLKIG
jgi:hypothetical protein